MDRDDLVWLAGLLEGEGHFGYASQRKGVKPSPLIQLIMNDQDVVQRAADLMGVGCGNKRRKDPRRADGFRARATGKRAIRLMEELHPFMGERRAARIGRILEECLGRYGAAGEAAAARRGT